MSRSVGTYFLIAHWEFPISLDACLGVCFYLEHWHVDYDACLSWLRIPMPWFFLCFIDIFVWDIDMLDYWWLIISYCLAHWFWFFHDCSNHFTCIHSLLYITQLDMLILWLVYYFDRLWAWCLYYYSSWSSYSRLSCVYMMIYLSFAWLRVAWLPSSPWLYVACLCG